MLRPSYPHPYATAQQPAEAKETLTRLTFSRSHVLTPLTFSLSYASHSLTSLTSHAFRLTSHVFFTSYESSISTIFTPCKNPII